MERIVTQVESTEEVWETTGQGWVHVRVTGVDGKPRSIKAGGRPGQKLRLSEYDRLMNEERVLDDRVNPFSNGMLLKVSPIDEDAPFNPNHLSVDAMVELFTVTGPEFNTRVDELNEYNVRRLIEACDELDATNSQVQYLAKVLAQKWPIGGDTPMYRELQGLGQVASPTQ